MDPESAEADWADDDGLQAPEFPEEQPCEWTLVSLDFIVAGIMVQVTRPSPKTQTGALAVPRATSSSD